MPYKPISNAGMIVCKIRTMQAMYVLSQMEMQRHMASPTHLPANQCQQGGVWGLDGAWYVNLSCSFISPHLFVSVSVLDH